MKLKRRLGLVHVFAIGSGAMISSGLFTLLGIHFTDGHRKIHTMFVLAGTRDEGNFHFRALATIASIVQKPSFDERWMQTSSTEELGDVTLLGDRKRHVSET
jgi:hypothetical protein